MPRSERLKERFFELCGSPEAGELFQERYCSKVVQTLEGADEIARSRYWLEHLRLWRIWASEVAKQAGMPLQQVEGLIERARDSVSNRSTTQADIKMLSQIGKFDLYWETPWADDWVEVPVEDVISGAWSSLDEFETAPAPTHVVTRVLYFFGMQLAQETDWVDPPQPEDTADSQLEIC